MAYHCPHLFDPGPLHAAAVYCSDGRVGLQFDDFLRNGLSLPRYDRVCLPGGPACLAGRAGAPLEKAGVMEELGFLVEAHGLERVVLIAHQGCAHYAARLGLEKSGIEQTQHADLVEAAGFVRDATGLDAVETYFARHTDDGMIFEPVPA